MGQTGSQEQQMYIQMFAMLLIPVCNFLLWTWIRECLDDSMLIERILEDFAWSTILKLKS